MTGESDLRSTVLETIAARRDELRTSEKAVADLILADPVRAMDFNMAGLADAAGVSEPTVMRFCSAIGFDGFRSFKITLAQTIALGLPVTLSAIHQDDSTDDLTEKIFSHTISSLDRARRNLDPASIRAAVDLLAGASDILFVGAGASGIVAQDAQQKFPLFGVPCQAPTDYHQQFIAATMSGDSTVTVAISNTDARRSRSASRRPRSGRGQRHLDHGDVGPLSDLADLDIRASTSRTPTTTPHRLAAQASSSSTSWPPGSRCGVATA